VEVGRGTRIDEIAAAAGMNGNVIAAMIDGRPVDLSRPLENDCSLAWVSADSPEGLDVLRHSTAHLMAQAVQSLFPGTQVTIGPTIEDGFYYDFKRDRAFTPEEIAQIETRMEDLAKANLTVTRQEMPKAQAIELFRGMGEDYKVAILQDLPDEVVSLYRQGDWADLCRGPHVPSTGAIKAFKLTGVAGAYWTTGLLMDATHGLQNPIPSYIVFRIDGPVIAFVAGAAALSALVSGLIPAYFASRSNASAVLKDSGRGHSSRILGVVNRALVVFQIVVTSILLVGSALQLQSIQKQQQIDYGYDTNGVLSARLGLMEGAYPDMPSKIAFFDRALRELRANPAYEQVAFTTRFQMIFTGGSPIEIEGQAYADAKDRPNANSEGVTDGYFSLLGARILEGRDFAPDDSDVKLPVAVVNSGFAKKHFGNESPLGRRFRSTDLNGQTFGPWRTIVGVVSDLRMTGPFNNPLFDGTGYYVPFYGNAFGPQLAEPAAPQFATVAVKPPAGRAADTLANTLLADIAKLDPDLPPYFVATPAKNLDAVLGQNRVVATMFSIFGIVAVVLSAVGLYGVMSFSVNQRRQEFGTRMVLGADRRGILGMVLKQGFVQLAIGLVVGLGLTLAIAQVGGDGIRRALFQVDPRNPAVYLAVSFLLAIVAFAATVVPARRATRVDPATALRAE
jgi:predicted permease